LRHPSPAAHRFIDILAPDVLDPLPLVPVQSQSHIDRTNRDLAMLALMGAPMRTDIR
jgi:hypothetical protein